MKHAQTGASALISVSYGPVRLARAFALLALAAPLLACDEYEKAYQDVAAAESGGAFNRGWLPPLLPADARNIVELHNLDTSEGWGCFDAPTGSGAIREKLQAAGAKRVSGPVGPRPTQYFITRTWWPQSMNETDLEVYELAETGQRRFALGIDASGRRACFHRGSR